MSFYNLIKTRDQGEVKRIKVLLLILLAVVLFAEAVQFVFLLKKAVDCSILVYGIQWELSCVDKLFFSGRTIFTVQ